MKGVKSTLGTGSKSDARGIVQKAKASLWKKKY